MYRVTLAEWAVCGDIFNGGYREKEGQLVAWTGYPFYIGECLGDRGRPIGVRQGLADGSVPRRIFDYPLEGLQLFLIFLPQVRCFRGAPGHPYGDELFEGRCGHDGLSE